MRIFLCFCWHFLREFATLRTVNSRSLLCLFVSLCTATSHAVVDENGDGLGDLWQLKYGAATLVATADADGDGQSNGAEAAAGTNPFVAGEIIAISSITRSATEVAVTWPSISGKRYQVECSASLDATSWTNIGSLREGNNEVLQAAFPIQTSHQFFRVRVSDIDVDGDGVTDWEEIQAGLDPNHSGPGQCNCGVNCDCYPECHCGDNDLDHLKYLLTAPAYVSIVALDSEAIEPGTVADPGVFQIKRSGGLAAITVALQSSGATSISDHNAVPSTVTLGFAVNTSDLIITPLADTNTESDEVLTVSIVSNSSYSLGNSPAASLLIKDNVQANGTGLWAEFYNEASNLNDTTNPPLFLNRVVTRVDPVIDYTWPSSTVQGVGSPAVGVQHDYFSSRWSGEILPEFSQPYTFELIVNRGGRLWVNGQLLINNWPGNGTSSTSGTFTGIIDLVAGKRVPIVLEQWENTGTCECHLRWQSASQAKVLIPTARMFPQTPPQILSDPNVLFLQHSGSQSWALTASGKPTSFSASALPPGWSMNASTGILSGPTDVAGIWKIPVTATNEFGSGSAILELNIVATGGSVTHETWTSVAGGATTANFAWESSPTTSESISLAEIPLHTQGPSAHRLRGYLTAPETGMYRFWVTGDDDASLWISNDREPINNFSRAQLTNATGFQAWPQAATSPILWLEAGKQYYWEARSVNQSGDGHLSVGWLLPSQGGKDPLAITAPTAVIPSYALSPWLGSTNVVLDGTLYTTQMAGQNGNITGAYGNATLQVNDDETQAVLRFSYANLTAPRTGAHIHSSAHGGLIIFDIDTATPEPDGSYVWNIAPVGAVSIEDIRNVIHNAQAYINVHSATYPAGEISGTFRQQTGSQSFTPPLAPPSFADDHSDRSAAVRFLNQATFGATESDIQSVHSLGYSDWIDQQFAVPATFHFPNVYATRNLTNPSSNTYSGSQVFNTWWKHSVTAQDQLRQRVAFALSQIFVVSESGPLDERADAISDYYDMLLDNSFGNARDLLENVSLHPTMGRYLDMLRNERPDKASGRIPNENYAREILQLFSIGLYRMHPDGSLMLDSVGSPIPTYGQEEIIGFAHAFTGWNYNQADAGAFKPTNWSPSSDWLNPMREVPGRHDIGPKRILNNVVLPGLPKITTSANAVVTLNPATSYASNATVLNDDEFQNLAAQELDATHDSIFQHPNFGPFLCHQLIQRLVTSTPSRAYIYRVAQVFANNGSGVRGDMKAVIRAILLDYEARAASVVNQQGFGKQKEPVIRVTNLARAFPAASNISASYEQIDGFINITTTNPHRLVSGNPMSIDFTSVTSGSPSAATSGNYSVSTSSGSAPFGTYTFSVRAKEVPNITYTQSGNTVTVTLGSHGLRDGAQVYLKFPAGTSTSQLYPITYLTSNTFSITVADSATRASTGAYMVKHTGGYAMAANSATVTITCNTNHHLTTGEQVYVDYFIVSGQTTGPTAGLYPVTVLDERRFTVENTAGTFTSSRAGTIIMSPQTPVLSFTGQANVVFSNYGMGETDTDLGQTPMRSPTVFNFYMPDYQFPGVLATNGLITPEFQLSSDTNVIRQANFLYEGVYKPNATNSIHSSFRGGNGVLAMDFTPWLATRPGGSGAWTENANLAALVDELSILLTANQLSAAARTVIVNYVGNTANITYPSNGTATDVQKIARLRAIIHLIATSPDFTIQR